MSNNIKKELLSLMQKAVKVAALLNLCGKIQTKCRAYKN